MESLPKVVFSRSKQVLSSNRSKIRLLQAQVHCIYIVLSFTERINTFAIPNNVEEALLKACMRWLKVVFDAFEHP